MVDDHPPSGMTAREVAVCRPARPDPRLDCDGAAFGIRQMTGGGFRGGGLAFLLVSSFVVMAVATLASASVVTLQYDDGEPASFAGWLRPGDREAVEFVCLHPCRLRAIHYVVHPRPEPMEFHVWGHNGGVHPDLSVDLIPPITVTPASEWEWMTVDLSEYSLERRPFEPFHVGYEKLQDTPYLLADASPPLYYTSHFFGRPREGGERDWYAIPADYLLRLEVEYFDMMDPDDFHFEDLTADAPFRFEGLARFAWGDYDNDGDDDLLVNGNNLYRNDGGSFRDVSEEAGIKGYLNGGGVWADYNNDGLLDFFHFTYFYPCTVDADCDVRAGWSCVEGRCTKEDMHGILRENTLWRNNGDGSFTDVTAEAGLDPGTGRTTAAAWADYDMDGCVDLYVASFESFERTETADTLWKNNCEGGFEDATEVAGIGDGRMTMAWGATWGDYDNDGDPDLYVSDYRLRPNKLWRNNGDGTFVDVAAEVGVAGNPLPDPEGVIRYGHTYASTWADFDNDGDLDLITVNRCHPRFLSFSDPTMLLRNSGPPDWVFTDIREEAGIIYEESQFEAAWGDFDNDGYLDLFITSDYWRTLYVYRNENGLAFSDFRYPSGIRSYGSFGLALADFDTDGFVDLVTNSYLTEEENTGSVFRNRGGPNNWIVIRPKATVSNRAAIGARVKVVAGELAQIREVSGGKGSGSQDSLAQHFGLGLAERVSCVQVRWPSGRVTTVYGIAANQVLEVSEDVQQDGPCEVGMDGDGPDADGGDGWDADFDVWPGEEDGRARPAGCGCSVPG